MYRSFFAGLKTTIPAAISLIPLGISMGLVSAQAGLDPLQTGLLSALMVCGSGQILMMGMLIEGTPLLLAMFSGFCMTLKNLIFSAASMQRLSSIPLWRRLICAFGLCDSGATIFGLSEGEGEAFLLGINWAIIISVTVSSIAGALMTGALPPIVTNSFGIAQYALFLAMLIPRLSKNARLTALVVFTAALNWSLRLILPTAWALIISMMAGAFIGVYFVDLEEKKPVSA